MEREPKIENKAEFNQAELEAKEATRGPEMSHESEDQRAQGVEAARAKVEQHTTSEDKEPAKESSPKRPLSGLDRRQAYQETMASIQRHLPTVSRGFSKVIHNQVVEKSSEAIGATVMRPSVTLGATTTALLVGAFTYWFGKHYGYAVSGSTILLSLIVGAIFGIVIEGIARLFHRKQ
jgi:hypothetical protein